MHILRKIIRKISRIPEEVFGFVFVNVKERDRLAKKRLSKENFFELYFSMIDPEDFFFVQIGANDGVNNDPIHSYVVKYNLRGIAVEPQPDVFKLLQETYKDQSSVACVNRAVAKETGTLPFYSMKEVFKTSANFSRVTGLATFQKDVLRKTIMRKIPKGASPDEYIQETQIKTLSFSDLASGYGIDKINLLQIDCEGYDYEILKMLDFNKFSPNIINFESVHLSDTDRKECETMLESHGYVWFRHGIDTCAYQVVK